MIAMMTPATPTRALTMVAKATTAPRFRSRAHQPSFTGCSRHWERGVLPGGDGVAARLHGLAAGHAGIRPAIDRVLGNVVDHGAVAGEHELDHRVGAACPVPE